MILLNNLQNVAISFFIFFVSHIIIISGNGISILQDKSNFLLLLKFTKCFFDTRVNQIVNKCFTGQLSRLIILLFLVP